MRKTLYRAANDDYVQSGISFAESSDVAQAYLDNPGFGGSSIFKTTISVKKSQIIDLREMDVDELAELVDMASPGAIGIDEWLPRTGRAIETLRESGKLWALVAESFPEDTTTWVWLGDVTDEEPELEPWEETG